MSFLGSVSPHAVTRVCAIAAILAIVTALAFVGCSPRKEPSTQYASVFSDSWQGKALRLEGASSIVCVQYSTAPGKCGVFTRKIDKTIEKFTGGCDVEGSTNRKYVSLNCRRADGSCIPGDNKILINLNASIELDGSEVQVSDSSLPRKINVVQGACEKYL
jgi:hypothetical protein